MHDLPDRDRTGILGYPRTDGRKGIRNLVAVVYTVECAHVVADAIAAPFPDDAHVIGFGGCYPSTYAHRMLERLCTHPNVGAAVLVSLGCEGLDRERLAATVAASGRPVTALVIQREGGTRATVEAGRAWINEVVAELANHPRAPIDPAELVVGTICGGSDGTSGITANPVVGRVFDRHVAAGGTDIFEETAELIACGSHVILFTTGRGSVVGSAISPVIKVCANPETYARMPEDMDVDAGRVLTSEATIDEVATELLDLIVATAAGRQTASEALGHREFVLTYKSAEPAGPSCLPTLR
jgi:altronate dehydratase